MFTFHTYLRKLYAHFQPLMKLLIGAKNKIIFVLSLKLKYLKIYNINLVNPSCECFVNKQITNFFGTYLVIYFNLASLKFSLICSFLSILISNHQSELLIQFNNYSLG